MNELKKEIKRVEQVIEKYEIEFDRLTPGTAKALLRDTLIKTRGILTGLKNAKVILDMEGVK